MGSASEEEEDGGPVPTGTTEGTSTCPGFDISGEGKNGMISGCPGLATPEGEVGESKGRVTDPPGRSNSDGKAETPGAFGMMPPEDEGRLRGETAGSRGPPDPILSDRDDEGPTIGFLGVSASEDGEPPLKGLTGGESFICPDVGTLDEGSNGALSSRPGTTVTEEGMPEPDEIGGSPDRTGRSTSSGKEGKGSGVSPEGDNTTGTKADGPGTSESDG